MYNKEGLNIYNQWWTLVLPQFHVRSIFLWSVSLWVQKIGNC